jgi:hypothetical protein
MFDQLPSPGSTPEPYAEQPGVALAAEMGNPVAVNVITNYYSRTGVYGRTPCTLFPITVIRFVSFNYIYIPLGQIPHSKPSSHHCNTENSYLFFCLTTVGETHLVNFREMIWRPRLFPSFLDGFGTFHRWCVFYTYTYTTTFSPTPNQKGRFRAELQLSPIR